MSYLSHLAARALNLAPGVQPRLTSRFEPPRIDNTPFEPITLEHESSERAVFTPDDPAPHSITLPPTVSSPTRLNEARETPRSIEPRPERSARAASAPPTMIEQVTHTTVVAHSTPAIIQHMLERSARPRTEIAPAARLEPTPASPQPAAATPAVRPYVPPEPERRPAPGAAAPVVHVTIGRVEVRATQSAPTPRSTPNKPATLTLDEYLRQRQGGSR